MTSQVGAITKRALNRALLDRQLLLRHAKLAAIEAIEHLVGMQSQVPNSPYVGLWTRLDGFHPDELAELIVQRQAVRIALMRGTIHLVSARDCLALRPVLQPVLDRGVTAALGSRRAEVDLEKFAAVGRALVEQQPRTFAELGKLLAKQWPDHDPSSLGIAIRALLPLVQVPPRGVWGASGPAAHTTAEVWLNSPLKPDRSPAGMVLRYLAAFGPAGVRDMQTWSGLTRLQEVVEQLRPELRSFRTDRGEEVFDLPGASRPDPDTPAPVRFLPEYDNCLRSHADRGHVVADDHRRLLFTGNDSPKPTFLVDGFVAGLWKISRQRTAATLLVEPFSPLSKADTATVTAEGVELLRFVAADAETHDVQFVASDP